MVVNAQTGTSSYGVYMRLTPHGPMQVSTLPVPLGGLGESSERPVVWPLNTRGLIGWQSCSHNTSASMHIFDIWLVSLLKDGTASPIPSVGQKWQRKPCQRQTLNFLELRLSKINPRTFEKLLVSANVFLQLLFSNWFVVSYFSERHCLTFH